jgi:hypothetical protein
VASEDETPLPTIGRIVVYRSRSARYVMPAVVSATRETLWRPGVEAGALPDLDSDRHVHLTVFTPGRQGHTTGEQSLAPVAHEGGPSPFPRSENQGGTYTEWNVPHDESGETPGSWSWPVRG